MKRLNLSYYTGLSEPVDNPAATVTLSTVAAGRLALLRGQDELSENLTGYQIG